MTEKNQEAAKPVKKTRTQEEDQFNLLIEYAKRLSLERDILQLQLEIRELKNMLENGHSDTEETES